MYVTIREKQDGAESKRRLTLEEDGGLTRFLRSVDAEKKRIRVKKPEDFQALLDEGRSFTLYKFSDFRFRWRSLLILNAETTHIANGLLYYKGRGKPFVETGALQSSDPDCFDAFILENLTTEDQIAAKKAAEIVRTQRHPRGINPYAGV